jgi:hypothetical protein
MLVELLDSLSKTAAKAAPQPADAVSPAARAALRAVQGFGRRLSPDVDHRAFLGDELLRNAIEDVLAPPCMPGRGQPRW